MGEVIVILSESSEVLKLKRIISSRNLLLPSSFEILMLWLQNKPINESWPFSWHAFNSLHCQSAAIHPGSFKERPLSVLALPLLPSPPIRDGGVG